MWTRFCAACLVLVLVSPTLLARITTQECEAYKYFKSLALYLRVLKSGTSGEGDLALVLANADSLNQSGLLLLDSPVDQVLESLDDDCDSSLADVWALSNQANLQSRTRGGLSMLIPNQTLSTGDFVTDVLVIDLDLDGSSDLVTTNQDSDDLSVFLGSASGVFGGENRIAIGHGPALVRTGDFNNDGVPDLVTADEGSLGNSTSGGISLLIGNGGGTFEPAVTLRQGTGPSAVAVGDFNEDQSDDIVQTNANLSAVSLLLGKGDGSFQQARNTDLSGAATALAAGDLNDDGHLDVVVGRTGGISVLLGDGSGDFDVDEINYGFNGGVWVVQTADLDLDGDLDIVAANTNNSVSILMNSGSGAFGEARSYAVGDLPDGLTILDLTDDGYPDIAVSNYNAEHLSILIGNGDGTFYGSRAFGPGGTMTAGDFDENGRLDLVLGSGNGEAQVLLGLPDGSFSPPQGLGQRGAYAVSADFDGDSHPDLALVRRNDNSGTVRPGIQILVGSGEGSFEARQELRFAGFSYLPGPIYSGLIDGDGHADLLAVDKAAGLLRLYPGNGDATFGEPIEIGVGDNPVDVLIDEFTGDDDLDFVVSLEGVPGGASGSVVLLEGHGDGTFEVPVPVFQAAKVQHISVGDLNADGHPDLVVANEEPVFTFNVSILIGDGAGGFELSGLLTPPGEFAFQGAAIAAADIDQDGKVDLVTGAAATPVYLFPGNGDGTFGAPSQADAGEGAMQLLVADLDFDRKPDLLAATNSLIVVIGNLSEVPDTSRNIVLAPRGAMSVSTPGSTDPLVAGYATARPKLGPVPSATGTFSLRQGSRVVSEVGVPASPPTRSARIFIDKRSGVIPAAGGLSAQAPGLMTDTGFAAVNLGGRTAHVLYRLRGVAGQVLSEGEGTIASGAHVSKFVGELKDISNFELPEDFGTAEGYGSLEIASDQPLSVIALRLTINQRGDALLTSTPIVDQANPPTAGPLLFPQFFNGGGGNTTLILLNTTASTVEGVIDLFEDDGSPLTVRNSQNLEGSSFPYSIPAGGIYVMQTDGAPSEAQVGWARVSPATGNVAPSGAGIFQISVGGIVVTESGIPAARPTRHARVFVDRTGGHNTGLALVAPAGTGLTATLSLSEISGAPTGTARDVTLGASGHLAQFADQLAGAPAGFRGILDIESDQPFAALTLRTLTNTSGDFLITTFPTADAESTPVGPLVFPQVADGDSIVSEFIFIGNKRQALIQLNYFDDDGTPLPLIPGSSSSSMAETGTKR